MPSLGIIAGKILPNQMPECVKSQFVENAIQ